MKEIYIIMSHSGTWVSKIIKIYTRASYSHVSLGFDLKLTEFYSFGRKHTYSPIGGGFVIEGIDRGIYKRCKKARCRVYKITLSNEKYEKLKYLIDKFINQQNHYKYNYLGIITIMFGLRFERKNYYFCSQFVAELLDNCSVWKFNKHFCLIKPKDFEEISEAKLIYEGSIAEYRKYLNNV